MTSSERQLEDELIAKLKEPHFRPWGLSHRSAFETSAGAVDGTMMVQAVLWLGTWKNGDRAYYYADDARKASIIRYKQP